MISKSSIKYGSWWGVLSSVVLSVIYFVVVSTVSGWNFMIDQFSQYWYFIVSLSIGFGVQIGLYLYLKQLIKHGDTSGRVVAVTGTTSTLSMISCCAHYLVNIIPVLGVTGLASFVGAYQIELFWFGLLMNLSGILFISNRIHKFSQQHE